MSECHHTGGNQVFLLTKGHEIRADELCADAVDTHSTVQLWNCHEMMGNQKWVYNNEVRHFQMNILFEHTFQEYFSIADQDIFALRWSKLFNNRRRCEGIDRRAMQR